MKRFNPQYETRSIELLRDKTNLVIRGINAKTHASNKDIAWTMLHILLSSDDLDENRALWDVWGTPGIFLKQTTDNKGSGSIKNRSWI